MKDKENIKSINKLSISYIMLKGLKGQTLEKQNPFLIYLMYNMIFKSGQVSEEDQEKLNNKTYFIDYQDGIPENVSIIPNDLFHLIMEESYEMYKSLNDIKNNVESLLSEQIDSYLENKDAFINELIESYKNSIIKILLNFNSKRESYNNIKIDILKEEMQSVVEIEDYDTAIIYRDKIKETEEKILEKKENENPQ